MFIQQSSPESRKAALIAQLASSENDLSRWAAHELRVRGWLTDGSLTGAALSGADLHEADLQGADLKRAVMHNVNLSGTCLSTMQLQGADLTGATLQDAYQFKTREGVIDKSGIGFHRANFAGAILIRANMMRAHLDGAVLQNAHLVDADLREATLRLAELAEADLSGADLRGTSLYRAELTGATLAGAQFDEYTTLPSGEKWSPAEDLARFTDRDHPLYWRYTGPRSMAEAMWRRQQGML